MLKPLFSAVMIRKAALFYDHPANDGEVFGQGRRERIAALTDLYPSVINARNFWEHAAGLKDLEVIFATWGMPASPTISWRSGYPMHGCALNLGRSSKVCLQRPPLTTVLDQLEPSVSTA